MDGGGTAVSFRARLLALIRSFCGYKWIWFSSLPQDESQHWYRLQSFSVMIEHAWHCFEYFLEARPISLDLKRRGLSIWENIAAGDIQGLFICSL